MLKYVIAGVDTQNGCHGFYKNDVDSADTEADARQFTEEEREEMITKFDEMVAKYPKTWFYVCAVVQPKALNFTRTSWQLLVVRSNGIAVASFPTQEEADWVEQRLCARYEVVKLY